ncbi:hypothetical protein TCAL_09958 [Tigriopus californicus]|uniref:RBR-type E3 ubiquitin transferase n=1 Tax=Tigriopus californicus TaxID=6832 RepID=A0A553P4L1_TIGCA|nr:hypothetical protein TCAL_09958 [Tigriopus californicus]
MARPHPGQIEAGPRGHVAPDCGPTVSLAPSSSAPPSPPSLSGFSIARLTRGLSRDWARISIPPVATPPTTQMKFGWPKSSPSTAPPRQPSPAPRPTSAPVDWAGTATPTHPRRAKFEADRRKEEQPRRKKALPPFRTRLDLARAHSGLAGSSRPSASPGADGLLPMPDSPPVRGRRPARFSLRRLFDGHPLLPPPWGQPLTSAWPSRSRRPAHPHRNGAGLEEGGSRTNATTPSSTRSRPFFPPDSTSERSVTHPSSASSAGMNGRDWRGDSHAPYPSSSCASSLAGGSAGPSSAHYPASFVGADGRAMRECSLCLVSLPLTEFPSLRNCHHLFCFDCLQIYVKIELQEGRVNVRCPQCVEPLHPNDIELFIGDRNSNLQHLYEFLMLRRILATDPDTRWCPGPNCTFAVIAAGCASCPKITCERPGCGFSFCYHCKAEWHPNQTCDMARAQRQGGHAQPGSLMMSMMNASTVSFSGQADSRGPQNPSEVKVCPRCDVLIVKMDDGSCNHMTCSVCGVEFCWLCMKEISDLHYLSPSGCTFWGKKPWSRKKKLLWQLGTLVGAPVGIALLAGISIPAMIIGIPVWVGRKLYAQYNKAPIHKRNLIIASGVSASVIVSPVIAALAVSIGVPILLAYVYGVVPISLCRSEGCGVSTSSNGVSIDVDEELNPDTDLSHMPFRPMVMDNYSTATGPSANWNPSIGEMSLGRSMSMGSTSHLDHEADRESASNTAVAGTSRTVSLASSSVLMGGVTSIRGVSTEGLSETASLTDPNQDGASTRALAGSILAYKTDTQSVNSFRTGGDPSDILPASGDEISLRSLPLGSVPSQLPRSLSPTASCRSSGHEDIVRRSGRRRTNSNVPHLERQLSEDAEDTEAAALALTGNDRVRFDDNVSFIDETGSCTLMVNAPPTCIEEGLSAGVKTGNNKGLKSDKPCPSNSSSTPSTTTSVSIVSGSSNLNGPTPIPLREETPEELAGMISPEIQRHYPASWSTRVNPSPCPDLIVSSSLNMSSNLEEKELEERQSADRNVTRLQIGEETDQ